MGRIITINRQFSSGGREVGKRLADELDCAYYDKELLNEIAKETGLDINYIDKNNEVATRNFGYTFSRTIASYHQSPSEKVQLAQTKIIREIGKIGDAIIIGKCSNHILEEYNPFKVFIYSSDINYCIERCFEKVPEDRQNKTNKQMMKEILAIDKQRAKYYEFYTGRKWLDLNNYNLCIDTSKVGILKAVEMIKIALS